MAWCAAFAVSSKQFLRGIDALPKEELLGVLSEEDEQVAKIAISRCFVTR